MTQTNQSIDPFKGVSPGQLQAMLKEIREMKADFPLKGLEPTAEHMRMAVLMKRAVQKIEEQESEYCRHDVEHIECHSRDGFSPYSFNQGGYFCYILKPLSSVDDEQYEKSRQYHADFIKDDNPEMDVDSEEFSELVYDSMAENSDDQCYLEARVMFHGIDDDGLYSATLSMIYRTSDAPYFRYADSFEDFEMEFKTAAGLELKLNKALVKAGVGK